MIETEEAPGAVIGAEVYRRMLPAGSAVRVYQGGILKAEIPAQGDTQITVGLSSTPQPVLPIIASLQLPTGLKPGQTANAMVEIKPSMTTAQTLTLTSGQPATILVPPTVTVLENRTTAAFVLTGGSATLAPGSSLITASLAASRVSGTVLLVRETAPDPGPAPMPEPGTLGYVSPTGRATNSGTRESPWDIVSATDGTHRARMAPGGTVWLLPGTYRIEPVANREGLGYRCVVGGQANNPLVFRGSPGGRVIIDGGWSFFTGSNYTWLRDVEVTVTDLVAGKPPFGESGSWPAGAPNGGVSFYNCQGCKVLNCLIYRNRQGINLWTEAKDAEAYGCVIYDNGWLGSDRAHGHGVYIQSPDTTTKRVRDCIFTASSYSRGWQDGRYTLHGYGQTVAVTNITAEGIMQAQQNDAFRLTPGAVAGGTNSMKECAINGVAVRLGRSPTQRLVMTGNVLSNGGLELYGTGEVVQTGNIIAPPGTRPSAGQCIVRPNQYETNRAHLYLIDWPNSGMVGLSHPWLSGELALYEPWNLAAGQSLWQGMWQPGGISLPVQGARVLVAVKRPVAGLVSGYVQEEEDWTYPTAIEGRLEEEL